MADPSKAMNDDEGTGATDGRPTERRSGRDRRRRYRPRLRERRSGFHRRAADRRGLSGAYERMLLAYGKNTLRYWTVLATIVVFNFLDLMLTLRALDRGAIEGNPVMRRLFWSNPMAAALVKLGVVAAVVLALDRMRRYRRALELSLLLLVGFTALTLYHAGFALGWIG